MVRISCAATLIIILSELGCIGVLGGDDTSSTTTAAISGAAFSNVCVEVEAIDGLAIFEGDIVVGKLAEVARSCTVGDTVEPERGSSSLIYKDGRYRWPDGVVPFFVNDKLSDTTKQRISAAIEHWHAKTKIRFIRRTNEASYVNLVPQAEGCKAVRGRTGGMQEVWLSPQCSIPNVIHELGHSVGLWHEQSRSDRDKYITINWANIKKDKQPYFKQYIAHTTDVGDYDYASRMHYPSTAFSINGKPTIVAKDPSIKLSNSTGLSQGDVAGVAAFYPNLPTRAADCSACVAGGDCQAACQAAGLGSGTCNNPGSAEPNNCCACNNGAPQPPPPPPPPPPKATDGDPTGVLDSVDDGLARGWACDRVTPSMTIDVFISVGEAAGSASKAYLTVANLSSGAAVEAACGGGTAHRFEYAIPDWTKHRGEKVFAHAIGLGGEEELLAGSPATIPQGQNPQPQPPPPPKTTGCASYDEVVCNHIPNCNSHKGDDEQACLAQGNTGGCSQEQLTAWCRRRVDASPGNDWYRIHEEWVQANCDGGASSYLEDGDGRGVYSCDNTSTCERYTCITPLVLLFGGQLELTPFVPGETTSLFDLSAAQDHSATRTDWPSGHTPWLVLDRDADGRITSGRELFGSATQLSDGSVAENGFEALAALDQDGNDVIDCADPAFARLALWADHNGDRISQPDELRHLSGAGVTALSLAYHVESRCDQRGNCTIERAPFSYRTADGTVLTGLVADVHLVSR